MPNMDLDTLRQRKRGRRRLKPTLPDIPIITVTACPSTSSFPMTTLYLKDSNILFPLRVYHHLNTTLRRIPPCTHPKPSVPEDCIFWPCHRCYDHFEHFFWLSCAYLLDYFADFYAADTPQMQGIWWKLVDAWVECAAWIPVFDDNEYIEMGMDATKEAYDKAAQFALDFEDAKVLLNEVIMVSVPGRKGVPFEPVIHDPTGRIEVEPGVDGNTGPWISGLKGWQQFLCVNAPGSAERNPVIDRKDGDMRITSSEKDGRYMMRQIPQPGLAILQRHGERILNRAAKLDIEVPLDTPTFGVQEPGGEAHQTSMFSKNIHIRVVDGMPPIMKRNGLLELDEDDCEPSFSQLDDALGEYTGASVYEPMSGLDDEDDEDDDDTDDGWSTAFDVLVAQHMYVRDGAKFVPTKEEDMFADWVL